MPDNDDENRLDADGKDGVVPTPLTSEELAAVLAADEKLRAEGAPPAAEQKDS